MGSHATNAGSQLINDPDLHTANVTFSECRFCFALKIVYYITYIYIYIYIYTYTYIYIYTRNGKMASTLSIRKFKNATVRKNIQHNKSVCRDGRGASNTTS